MENFPHRESITKLARLPFSTLTARQPCAAGSGAALPALPSQPPCKEGHCPRDHRARPACGKYAVGEGAMRGAPTASFSVARAQERWSGCTAADANRRAQNLERKAPNYKFEHEALPPQASILGTPSNLLTCKALRCKYRENSFMQRSSSPFKSRSKIGERSLFPCGDGRKPGFYASMVFPLG